MNRLAVALVSIVALLSLSAWLGHMWPGLIAAAIAGTMCMPRGGGVGPVAKRIATGEPSEGAVIVVTDLGQRPIEVIRRLRALGGLTVDECSELARAEAKEFAGVRLSFHDPESAAVGVQALTKLGARVERS